MSKETQRASFLETISPWNISKSPTVQPGTGHGTQDILQRSQGEDHTVSHRHRLSLRYYPNDCPPLRVRWFYAVDSPKWKPTYLDQKKDPKPLPPPKKFIPFMLKDSQSIEHAFQKMSDIEMEHEQAHYNRPIERAKEESVKVPVNEDYLYDVDVKRRELSPTYWSGPIYEVRRGTWFFQDGSTFKPCEENLATQLEEGYLKVKPWKLHDLHDTFIQNPPKPDSYEQGPDSSPSNQENFAQATSAPTGESQKYRLFGSYMNSVVAYQDSSTALITNDDFMSRVSTTVYQKLGGIPGTRVMRGFTEPNKPSEGPTTPDLNQNLAQGVSSETHATDMVNGRPNQVSGSNILSNQPQTNDSVADMYLKPKLEQPAQSFAHQQDVPDLEEQTRIQEEREIEASRETDGDDREREIDHLVLVTHGIGQRLGLRLESINFIHDVNVLRKTMKNVYKASPDLQALNSAFSDKYNNCRVQVLPVCWRHLLDFPYQRVGQSRKELDLADADTIEEDLYPSLADITLESVPAVRNLISDLAVDVLLYQSAYCKRISTIVRQECNRILELYKKRNPTFSGSVSLCGHSLGSAILFDILCAEPVRPTSSAQNVAHEDSLSFECQELFCLGSPIALFQMLKGSTIAGRAAQDPGNNRAPVFSMQTTDAANVSSIPNHHSSNVGVGTSLGDNKSAVSSPRCRQLYNIFHPSDPVGYRMEPLISAAMSSLKPQPLPSVKKSIWTASGQSLSLIGTRVGQSVGSLWTNFTSGVASSLLNRSLGLYSEDNSSQSSPGAFAQLQKTRENNYSHEDRSPTLIDPNIESLYGGFQKTKNSRGKSSEPEAQDEIYYQETERRARKIKIEDEKVRLLNSNGRVDYSIQEGAFDISLIASIASHLSYWADEDVNHFMLSQMLCRKKRHQDTL